MTDRQSTHGHDCWDWGPKHYECAVREIERLAARLAAETNNARGEVEYEYEVWQDGVLLAGGRETDCDSAQSEAGHYAAMYTPDGPVEVRIYEKRLLSITQQSVAVDDAMVEAVARAICMACEENPDSQGDTRGNKFRWQDYRDTAVAAISALAAAQRLGSTAGEVK